jgi:hypothetical protein
MAEPTQAAHDEAFDGAWRSRQNPLHWLAGHVGQPEIAALQAIGRSRAVDAQQVQECRLEIERIDGVVNDVVAKLVGRLARDAAANTPPHSPIEKQRRGGRGRSAAG